MSGVTLDAGALIALERNDRRAVGRLALYDEANQPVYVPAGVLGQVWRDGTRQVWLVRLLATESVTVVALADYEARAAGQLCGVTRTSDVIDASVVLCARQHGTSVMTSDPVDLRRLDPTVELILV